MLKNILTYSDLESKRFKMKIYRGVFEKLDFGLINKEITENLADVVILRVPSHLNAEIGKLSNLGFPYIQADTLVYYYTDFTKYEIKPLANSDISFDLFSEKDQSEIDRLVEQIFAGYTNHYDSNPYFDKSGIMDGYKQWMHGFIGNEDKLGWFVKRNGINIGFASCSIADNVGEGVLYGVIPSAAGGGVYTDIIRFTQNEMKTRGINTMKVSTQIQNYAVQKVWAREGFYLKESFATIHINSLLSYTQLPKKELFLNISENDIAQFGNMSGDNNPVHFDSDFARQKGFKQRIAHGLIPNSLISRFFGTDFPGIGTLFMGYRYKFYKPLYPNENHKIEFTFPYFVESKGIYLAVVKIFNEQNELCLVSYNDLMKR